MITSDFKVSEEIRRQTIINFFKKNQNMTEHLKAWNIDDLIESDDVIMSYQEQQIYAYLNLINDNKNIYKHFLKILKRNYDLEKYNCLEVGCGVIPVLANYLYKLKKNKEIVTVIDPLVEEKFANEDINVVRYIFDSGFSLDEYQLLYGHKSCSSTEEIIKQANKNKKEFCVKLCNCPEIKGMDLISDKNRIAFKYIYSTQKEKIENLKGLANSTLPKRFMLEMKHYEENGIKSAVLMSKERKIY